MVESSAATLRVALAQVNPTVGDLAGNMDLVDRWARSAAEAQAGVVVFSEMTLTGYPVEDLAHRAAFVQASRTCLEELAGGLAEAGCAEVLTVVGYLDEDAAGPRNSVAALYGGKVVARQAKHHLPNYGVFDERRNFVPGMSLDIVRVHGIDVGMVICEDLWQAGGPVCALGLAGVDLVVAPNASPYERSKDDIRLPLIAERAREGGAPLLYCNQVGGQDDLVFDGDSCIVDAGGHLLARAPQFVEHLLISDLELPAGGGDASGGQPASRPSGTFCGLDVRRTTCDPPAGTAATAAPPARALGQLPRAGTAIAEPLPDEAEVWAALTLGLRDYVRKNGFPSVLLGLSGGIDSATTAALAADALGPRAVHGVSMPSAYSSAHSRDDAAETAARLGCHFRTEPIDGLVAAYCAQLSLTGLAEENIQARVRGALLMALSNAEGHLVLAPGNKTEIAVGYSTLYGDSVGGFAPLKDVFKTQVWALARWRNDEADRREATRPIPEGSITKPPSAELRPGQLDTDSLPDYGVLDDILDDYVEGDRGFAELQAAGFAPATIDRVVRMVDAAEYKRRQYPPGTKITFKAFGRDRRLPITNAWREVH